MEPLIALAASGGTILSLSDGPTALLQWLLFKKSPAIVATLESYRWQPSDPASDSQVRDENSDGGDQGLEAYSLPDLPFVWTPPSTGVVAAWACLVGIVLCYLVSSCCRRGLF